MKNHLEFKFWGVRGTMPASDRRFLKFGGHTICTEVSGGDEIILVDAGTGIKRVGNELTRYRKKRDGTIHLFMTHFHLDHIQGLPFFGPLYSKSCRIHIYAPFPPDKTEEILCSLMGGRFFPMKFTDTHSRKIFHEVGTESLEISGIRISCCPLRHPQGAVAYKFEKEGSILVTATDTEHPEEGVDNRLAAFSEGADALIYDATFEPEEYRRKRMGWGHSTWEAGTALAKKASVKKLLLSHHNPDYSDGRIEEIMVAAQKIFPQAEAARECLLYPSGEFKKEEK